jgi:hypothetical protein
MPAPELMTTTHHRVATGSRLSSEKIESVRRIGRVIAGSLDLRVRRDYFMKVDPSSESGSLASISVLDPNGHSYEPIVHVHPLLA